MPTNDHADAPPEAPAAGRRRLPYGVLTASVLAALIFAIAVVMAFSSDDGDGADDDSASAGPNTTIGSTNALVSEDPTGDPLPDTSLETFDGEVATFADVTGGPMVVNFFASWCTPCIKEMPDFEAVHQDLGDEVRFVGVNSTDRLEDGERIVEQTGVTYELLRDESGDALAAIGGTGMPVTLLVDPDGTVLSVHTRALSEQQLRDLIASELGVGG